MSDKILHLRTTETQDEHIFFTAKMVNGNFSVNIRRQNDIAGTLVFEMRQDGHGALYPRVLEDYGFVINVQGFYRKGEDD